MDWVYLILAGLMEMGWPLATKFAWTGNGLRGGPAAAAVACMLGSTGLLLLAQRSIPIGTAYAVWTGIGAVGTFILGLLILNEPVRLSRVIFIGLIVVGVVGLKVTAAGPAPRPEGTSPPEGQI
jgi:quaternary ammonium compound-resistance protein SugE